MFFININHFKKTHKMIKNLVSGFAAIALVVSCSSSGDVIGMDEINLNGPKQIIQTVTTNGNPNVVQYSVGGNKLVKVSDTGNNFSKQISYSNNKIASISGFSKDNTGVLTNFNISFSYSGNDLTGLQGTEETGGVISDIVTNFTYTGGKLTKTLTARTTPQIGGTPLLTYSQNELSYQGYNVSQSTFTIGNIVGGAQVPLDVVTTIYSNYDSKVSYLYGIPTEYAVFSTYNTTGMNYLSPNNAQSITINQGGANVTKNYTYTYGNSAMPTSSNDGTGISTFSYQAWKN